MIKTSSILKIGEFHPTFCEDFLYHEKISKEWFIAAVMDGCSSGKNSHFASTLFGKLLKKVCKELPYLELKNPSLNLQKIELTKLSQIILEKLFEEIKKAKNSLFLEVQELVSTCILLVYHISDKKAWINVSGDGVLAINQKIILIEQNDKPNYLSYHLNLSFEEWFTKQTNSYLFEEVENLAISTDGVLSFAKNSTEDVKGVNPIEYLLLNSEFENQPNMLERKCIQLEKEFNLKPNDDLGIIRIVEN